MKSLLARVVSLSLLLRAASAAAVNGWYPCAFSTFHNPGNRTTLADMAVFECAERTVPLCYEGICNSDREIQLFVRRRLATKRSAAPRKAVILIQGGPGGSSIVMEDTIFKLVDWDDDTVDYYTFDHRGTGRSEYLACDAAAALTPGSPEGTTPTTDELPNCLQDLNFQYDGQAAAFSVTSAAMDVRSMITTFMKNDDVFIAGVSYGTFLAQRILQLEIPQVKGYVFNGVDVLTTEKDPIESANSHWNQAMKGPARRLLEFCFDDPKCPIKFKARETVLEEVLELLDEVDREPNDCAKVVAVAMKKEIPSDALGILVFNSVIHLTTRVSGLALLGAVQRCNQQDLVDVQTATSQPQGDPVHRPLDPLHGHNQLLYNVIVFSERFHRPAPTHAERNAFFRATPIASDVASLTLDYCLFTGAKDTACEELQDQLPPSNATFVYERDEYYDKALTLPQGVSALVLNGGLDFQTPREFGELLYQKLRGSGDGVMMVDFDYGVHCKGEAVAEALAAPCRDAIVRQFIARGGDLAAVDTRCMASLPTTAFHFATT